MAMTNFTEPKLIKSDLLDELDSLVGQLRNLSIRKPQPFQIQEAQMDARMADFLELAEQEYIKGWTDCEEGARHLPGKSQAYDAGYGDCYEYEQRQHSEPVIGSYEEMDKGDK
jgi:hypothetical protein